MINRGMMSSDHPDWATPPELFELYRDRFDLNFDVCATEDNAKCERFWSPEDDALLRPWDGRCWMNPPYGRGIIQWVHRAAEQIKSNPTCEIVVALLPSRTCTEWFHDWVLPCADIEFIRGRITFVGAPGPAPFPSLIAVYGRKGKKA